MVSKVKRDTIREFCRKCIYEKITEEEIESCPVCNIDLGGTPLDKIRPDHNLQDLTTKIFPLKQTKVKARESARRKERFISSLVVTTPKVSVRAGTMGRKTKAATRKELRDSGYLADERTVKEEESLKVDLLKSTSSCDTKDKQQSAEAFSNKENKDDDEPCDPTLNWKPLNFLVQVANMTKPLKFSASQGPSSKSEQADASHKPFQGKKNKVKDHKSKCKRKDDKISEASTPKRLPRTQRKRHATTFGDSRNSPQQDESSAKRKRMIDPVWFSLVASTDQKNFFASNSSRFFENKDGNIQVSFIPKYLVRKLDLQSEAELEIRCMGEAVIPTVSLQTLVELWLQRSSKCQRVNALTGSSAKDYMMVLVYGPKLP